MVPSTANVFIEAVPWSTIKFPPDSAPGVLPPPVNPTSLSHPFNIPANVFEYMLETHVPITIAAVYATTVLLLNRYNASRGNKPWAISKTKFFFAFVLAHNIFLAVYSAWTFVGITGAMLRSVPSPFGPAGLPGLVDGLCKIHGPRGLGNAATYNPSSGTWGFSNNKHELTASGVPASTDVGRFWNEGLAYYGWLFYLSKFYEVLDTLIILAKGKRSSTLQTYHHAGAMMCMWAGIRFMAPAIWSFCFLNSAIHAMMYTYYTLTALSFKIPVRIKRSLTTMQITQFLVGVAFAFSHLFVAYNIPVWVPYTVSQSTETTSVPEIATSAVTSAAIASVSAGVGSWVKKLALRAAGVEGAAVNVENQYGQTFGADAARAAQVLKSGEEIHYRQEQQLTYCTDTSGQAFAVLLNCFYLAPLTVLFVRFFIKSYVKRSRGTPLSKAGFHANEASIDAARSVGKQITEELGSLHGSDTPLLSSPSREVKEQLAQLKDLDKALESAQKSSN